jgi:hypothetical protein
MLQLAQISVHRATQDATLALVHRIETGDQSSS